MKRNSLFKTSFGLKTLSVVMVALFFFAFNYSCNNNAGDSGKSPITLSPDIPVDVDPALQEKLKAKGDNFYELNQAFNQYSWQAFVAIMWPRDKEGKAMPNFNDKGKATWLGWKEAFEVYRCDGGVPSPWGAKRTSDNCLHPGQNIVGEEEARVFLASPTPAHHGKSKNIADEEDQAFAGKLFDQNGHTVVYEVLMNKEEFDYVLANKLYNINGQITFTGKNGQIANFPAGDFKTHKVGAVEIKLAWKVLQDSDIKERYYRSEGYVVGPDSTLIKKNLGMIGFHISQKTPTGKQWVWSTFEQIDNLAQNVMEKDGRQIPIHPSLTDPDCEICPVNVDVSNGTTFNYNEGPNGNFWTISGQSNKYYANSKIMKTQAKRMINIPVRVRELNMQMQAFFKSQGSVWQYYQLIDTQYPTDQNAPPGNHTEAGYKLPESVTNKPGGKPNLTFLTNISMETFFQVGNQDAANFMEAFNTNTGLTVFGTEGCMGCHSSAGIYNGIDPKGNFTKLPQLSGDFSWLLSQKAQWDKKIPRALIPPPKPVPVVK